MKNFNSISLEKPGLKTRSDGGISSLQGANQFRNVFSMDLKLLPCALIWILYCWAFIRNDRNQAALNVVINSNFCSMGDCQNSFHDGSLISFCMREG
ncbi:hypothetical protein OA48_25785 [Klebsiella variicola]|nr:hypothetical protein CYU57_10425 [Klebsiella pneumoniae]KKY91114.1 hypothetical protein OA48_25785 [Klebsiella variicola]PQO63110.1 hypothetical protein C5706_01645 [Klebsiella pneumoniae]HBY4559287.1 hypothetical protein [Klebsiella pneumoniae]HBY5107469.1 hypothetical protein [Klebsiella pneumoniae]